MQICTLLVAEVGMLCEIKILVVPKYMFLVFLELFWISTKDFIS